MIIFDSGLTGLIIRQWTKVSLEDHFLSGTTTSGSVGQLGWLLAGTGSSQASESGSPGIIRLDTTTSSGTHSRVSFHNTSSFNPGDPHVLTWRIRLNTNDANTTARFGSTNSVTANPPVHGVHFEKLDADTDWFCVTRSSSVQTRTDSGIAVNTNMHVFKIIRSATGVDFYIDNVRVASQATNIPTSFLSPYAGIINSAAASKTLDLDYFSLSIPLVS